MSPDNDLWGLTRIKWRNVLLLMANQEKQSIRYKNNLKISTTTNNQFFFVNYKKYFITLMYFVVQVNTLMCVCIYFYSMYMLYFFKIYF